MLIPINNKNEFIGQSIEDKVRLVTTTNAPVESISPMIYTERKEGVKPEHNIRTDKWDIAQQAMDTIAKGMREKRQERIKARQTGQDQTGQAGQDGQA